MIKFFAIFSKFLLLNLNCHFIRNWNYFNKPSRELKRKGKLKSKIKIRILNKDEILQTFVITTDTSKQEYAYIYMRHLEILLKNGPFQI